jgi:hypothetical protein
MNFTLAKFFNKWQETAPKIKNFIIEFWSHLYAKIYSVVLLITILANWLMAFYIDYHIKDSQIALHYNVDFGIDYYGNINQIYIIPVLGVLIAFFNLIILIISYQHKDRHIIAHILLSAAEIVNIILLIALVSLYLINS